MKEKQTPNAKCPGCGRLFYSPEADIYANEIDESLYCSAECLGEDSLTDEEIEGEGND
jgi:hypothetical protein